MRFGFIPGCEIDIEHSQAWEALLNRSFPEAQSVWAVKEKFPFLKPPIDSLSAQAATHLETSEFRETVLIGHSWGSVVALKTALMYPTKVKALISCAGYFDPRQLARQKIEVPKQLPFPCLTIREGLNIDGDSTGGRFRQYAHDISGKRTELPVAHDAFSTDPKARFATIKEITTFLDI